ncbi:hypothetical protein R6Q59_005581 [Mikania micrantha]
MSRIDLKIASFRASATASTAMWETLAGQTDNCVNTKNLYQKSHWVHQNYAITNDKIKAAYAGQMTFKGLKT